MMPTLVSASADDADTIIVEGSNHRLAIKADGTLWAWGWYRLGNGIETDIDSRVEIPIR
jgi:alpha-tubulin suppressor-like RCC1 family protein